MRYLYDLFKLHVWKDMFMWKPFWKTWGVKQTLIYLFIDTLAERINQSYYEKKVSNAMKIVIEELKKDKTPGSWYYTWQSNIACIIMDNSDIGHEKANEIAIKFLDILISD